MGPPFWIHCNLCYYLFARKDRKFYQMNCLHVLCKNCMAHTHRGTFCPVCKRQGVKFLEISNTMDKKVKALYDPDVSKILDQAIKATNFQLKQRQHLIEQILTTEEKLEKAEKMEQIMKAKIFEAQQQYDKARSQRRSMQEALRQQLNSSPEDLQNSQKQQSKRSSSDFFNSNSNSSDSDWDSGIKNTTGDSKDSFLNMKGAKYRFRVRQLRQNPFAQ
ncbi:RING finger protein vilya-like isoform X2 [Toxorhynchites rutilus septentrionalis]|uniref:RING finger protein vilya-like isoform X2 n=1 Tax=Toxorhynchites rutilus septentrionalis TaxID=329112 RepID=UPI0024796ECF|nr:RING finger protein vilya-like isoform X2 [Toxorhynchites rutilus septentrionalis]